MLDYWKRVLKDAEIEREIYICALRYNTINVINSNADAFINIIVEKIQTTNELIKQARENIKKCELGGGEVDD